MLKKSPHTFHIPVMGIAFTLDTPIKVAAFGINSTLSIIEDNIIEVLRKHYYNENKEVYHPITTKEENYRIKRITDYLNLVDRNVKQRFSNLKNSAFQVGSEIVKYFEMLPDGNELKEKYLQYISINDQKKKTSAEASLRKEMAPGIIEVNIMTKVDKDNHDGNGNLVENSSDALSALKAYAESNLENSAVVFSAGMNPRLYNYLEKFTQFDADENGEFSKRIVIKVSDYRSALIQGKYLAKKGIWVSEFRIESGLNCGGHAFATPGLLLGPILEEFKNNRKELSTALFELYSNNLKAKGKKVFQEPHSIAVTVQGGIGTHEEDSFLLKFYNIDSTGWGTPFLLCPEATTVDDETLKVLSKAGEKDVVLSKSSPLGVPFNYLKGTSAEKERVERILKRNPGSPCTEKFLVSNTEYTKEPICTASKKYQKLKLEDLKNSNLTEIELQQQVDNLLSKECLCVGLSNASAIKYKIPFLKKLESVTICPGPNISNFSKITSLKEMTDHIYGRIDLVQNKLRPHMFLKELELYVINLKEEIRALNSPNPKNFKGWKTYGENLKNGINYYRELVNKTEFWEPYKTESFLKKAETEVERLLEGIEEKQLAAI